jgi:hypothetical protein
LGSRKERVNSVPTAVAMEENFERFTAIPIFYSTPILISFSSSPFVNKPTPHITCNPIHKAFYPP